MPKSLLTGLLMFVAGICFTLLALTFADRPTPLPMLAAADDGPALTADHLAAKISPVIQAKLVESKGDIIDHAGGPIARTAVKMGFPIAVRETPTFCRHGVEALLDEFGHYSLSDLAKLIESHIAAREGHSESRLLRELRATAPGPFGHVPCRCGPICGNEPGGRGVCQVQCGCFH